MKFLAIGEKDFSKLGFNVDTLNTKLGLFVVKKQLYWDTTLWFSSVVLDTVVSKYLISISLGAVIPIPLTKLFVLDIVEYPLAS